MAQDAVLLNSGGIDSRVSAAIAHSQGYTLHSLLLDFNQPNRNRAQLAAQTTGSLYCADHRVVKYDCDFGVFSPATGNFALPMHGLFLLLVGVQYAISKSIGAVVSGFDGRTYTSELINQLHDFMAQNTFRSIEIAFLTPFKDQKEDTLLKEYVTQLQIPLDDTVSCGSLAPCGVCQACQRRIALGLTPQ